MNKSEKFVITINRELGSGSYPDELQGHAKRGEETEDTWYDLE